MKQAYSITSFEQTKTLADPKRMRILRLLMAEPLSLTRLAHKVNQSPGWVRHHIQKLMETGLVELTEIRHNGTITEKFYQAKGSAFLLQKTILPETNKPILLFAGSHDFAIERLAHRLAPYMDIIIHPIGSLDGLISLHQGICQFSGVHLLDENGDYNIPYIRRLFPQHDVRVITLAHRVQGLITQPDNPKGIHKLIDLTRSDIKFINRNPGSGTRIWLDNALRQHGISPDSIQGYEFSVSTHTTAARNIAEGKANAAIGLQAAADIFQLHFIPLFEERFDLVFPANKAKALSPLLNEIQSVAFRETTLALGGYNVTHSGEEIKF